jgi:ribosomal protein L11 methyltransferase
VRDRAATALNQQFANISVWAVDIADDDWAARSQASLRAIQVGDIIVAPPWDIPSAPRDNHHVIVIQPSMGFGTGHHATTRLCLRALQQVVVQGSRVIDVGTGSGVLGIAASRLGAREVLAIDDDPDALRAAEENVALNGASNVTLRLADLRAGGDDSRITPASDHFDVVLANLTGALLSAAAGQLQSFAARQGHLILSGFTLDEETAVCQAFADCLVENRAAEEGWVCATVKRRA